MKTHPKTLLELAEDTLSEAEAVVLQTHLDSCLQCRAEMESLRFALEALKNAGAVDSRDFAQRREPESSTLSPKSEVRSAYSSVSPNSEVPSAYFSTILPRVRAQIDRRSSLQGLSLGESLSRLVAPLAASVAVVLLLVSVSPKSATTLDDALSWSSAMEYLSENDYPWLSGEALALQDDYFVQDAAAISELPSGLSEISSLEFDANTSYLSDTEMESLLQALQERTIL